MAHRLPTADHRPAQDVATATDGDVGFGDLVSQMLAVGLVLLSFTTVVTWMAWTAR